MRVGPAAIGVLAPYLIGPSRDAAQLPARFGVQFALPASLWVQKETIGKGSCRVGPAGYDDAGAMLWVLNGNITGSVTLIHRGIKFGVLWRREMGSWARPSPNSANANC